MHGEKFVHDKECISVPPTILYTPVFINTVAVSGTEGLGKPKMNSFTSAVHHYPHSSQLSLECDQRHPASESRGTPFANLFAGCGVIFCGPVHSIIQ